MRSFLWKEWRENWQSVMWAPLLVMVLTVMAAVYNVDVVHMQSQRVIDPGFLVWMLGWIWLLSTILCGSSMVAPEIGSGTLQFLSALPISRQRIWTVKCLVGFTCALLCIIATTLVFVVTFSMAKELGAFASSSIDFLQVKSVGTMVVLFGAPLFSMGMLMTMMVDRTISAILATVIASAAVCTIIASSASVLDLNYQGVDFGLWGMAELTVPTLLSMSFRTFVRGETLKTSKRFKVAIPGLVIDIAIILAALIVSVIWILW